MSYDETTPPKSFLHANESKPITMQEHRRFAKLRRLANKVRRAIDFTIRFNDPDRFTIDNRCKHNGKPITYGQVKAERLATKNERRVSNGLPPLARYSQI